jgi:translation elongation factor EF-Tu-like GTPase
LKKNSAKYQIEETFRINGRGIVLAGIILDGTINIENYIQFEYQGNKILRKITGIEGISSHSEKLNTGILIECINEEEIMKLTNWKPKKVLGLVFKTPGI